MSAARIYFLFVMILFVAAALSSRLFSLQIREQHFWQAMAKGQQQLYEELLPERGRILFADRDGKLQPAAMNISAKMLYAVPKEVEDPAATAELLGTMFPDDAERMATQIKKKDDPYEPLAHRLSEAQVDAITQWKIPGLSFQDERIRVYPQKDFASHVIGFVGRLEDGTQAGTYGVEGAFESRLRGEEGVVRGEKDVAGTLIQFLSPHISAPQGGADIVLTIDFNVQRVAEEALKKAAEKWEVDGASIIVMDPLDGAIRAMASLPAFDPNTYSHTEDHSVFVNPAISHLFEPGSVIKPVTIAAAIDAGALTPHTTYDNTNEVRIGGYIIRNVVKEKLGLATMIEMLQYSLNTGAVFAEQQLGHERFKEYLERFGLEEKTGVGLPGEVAGNLLNLREAKDINYATASFGQGIAVTPLALIRAIAAIANGGMLIEPHIVSEIRVSDATQQPERPPRRLGRQAISPKTASQVTAMMVSAVRNGTGKRANIPGYTIAGKTGTAEVPSKDRRGYEPGNTIHSFVGFAPAFDPKFIILVKLDNPKGVRYAEGSAVPVFREVAEYLFSYYGIAPDDNAQ